MTNIEKAAEALAAEIAEMHTEMNQATAAMVTADATYSNAKRKHAKLENRRKKLQRALDALK